MKLLSLKKKQFWSNWTTVCGTSPRSGRLRRNSIFYYYFSVYLIFRRSCSSTFFWPRFGWIAYTLLSLFSSGDDSINLAGGISKFVTDISVSFSGICIWSGPATFKATCQMEVDNWPFDQQKCELSFGSHTYGENLLRIRQFADKSDFASKELSLLLL